MKDFIHWIKKELRALIGEATKDKNFYSQNIFKDETTAREAFLQSQKKLLNINKWSNLPGFTSTFEVFDNYMSPKQIPEKGDFIKISLPGPLPENWVRIHKVYLEENFACISVHPDKEPSKNDKLEVDHFFTHAADNNFIIELDKNKINAFVIGRREGINNRGTEAGKRAVINTLVAEGGWAFFQDIQWQKLTDYLVHILEIKERG